MINRFQSILGKFSLNPKRLFLIDSLGALLTAFLTGTVLVKFQDVFGMPHKALSFLSIMAYGYAVYSLGCYFFIGKNWRPYLKVIAIANLIYCCVTIALVFFFYPAITILGLIYFFGELMVIGILISIELMTLSHAAQR